MSLSLPGVHVYVQIGLPCIYGYTDVRMDECSFTNV